MKQPSKQHHRNNRNNNKGGRRSSGGGGGGGGGGRDSANRVYDSAGPEGKVRGTAQQIIDKYTSLAQDALTSGEIIMAENFYQHAEHYQRILTTIQAAEAEERERRAQVDQERREQQQQREQARQENSQNSDQNSTTPEQRNQNVASSVFEQPSAPDRSSEPEQPPIAVEKSVEPDGPSLIETPEARRAEEREAPAPRARRARAKPAVKTDSDDVVPEATTRAAEPEAGADDAPVKPKRGRPRKTPPPAEEVDVPS